MSRQIAGWKVDTEQREELLRRFPPGYAEMGVETVSFDGADQPSPAMPGSAMSPKQPCKKKLDQLPLRHASLSVVQQPGTSR